MAEEKFTTGKSLNRHEPVHARDVQEVGSRISWSAILAGAMIATVVCFVLFLLGMAIGLTFVGEAEGDTLSTGAAIWAIATTLTGLFLGGWVTSQCEVGETRAESLIHGAIMWGVTAILLVTLAGAGIGSGFSALVSSVSLVEQGMTSQSWQQLAESSGISRTQIEEWMRQGMTSESIPRMAEDVRRNLSASAWWAYAATLFSLLAAMAGAVIGSGPNLRLAPSYKFRDRQLETVRN
jgi:hypothetical protein